MKALILVSLVLLCGCQQAQDGSGMVLSPVGEVALEVAAEAWVPLQFRPLVWLLGAALSGAAIDRKIRK
jgi:hypothetical protein